MSFMAPNQQRLSTEGNTRHWPKPVAWPHPCFIHNQTANWYGIAPFVPAFLFSLLHSRTYSSLSLLTCHQSHLSVCLSVGQSVWRVNCGKMADWIWMPFGVVSGIGVLDGGGDRQRKRGSFGGNCGASHCNQWGLCDVVLCCDRKQCSSSQITLGFLVNTYTISTIKRINNYKKIRHH